MGTWVSRTGPFPGYTRKESVTAGSPATVVISHTPAGRDITVTAIPGGGGTANVQFSTSSDAEVAAATATWQDWPSGAVSSTTSDRVLSQITALKLIATTADAVFELVV